jgi:hypothetical protein
MRHHVTANGTDVILLKPLFTEPLFHFLALALVIFAVHGFLQPTATGNPDSIVVTAAKIDQLGSVFAKTWQRPPNADELKGLIDDYVKEEIYVREALALGLDQDDTVIRRRLHLKMEFMSDAGADVSAPTDADLEAYLKAHAVEFEVDPLVAFRQVFFSPERRGDTIDQDATAILESLLRGASMDPATLGDATLLPYELPLTSKSSIGQTFGPEFAEAIYTLDPDQWAGPVKSDFGLHIVHVSERRAGRLPPLGEIRAAVAREWTSAKRKELEDDRLNDLLKRYRVIIEMPGEGGANQ